jgi:phosphate transport system substrate-binding protein
VKANLDSLTEAAASVQEIPADFRVSITNAPGNNVPPQFEMENTFFR